MYMMVWRKEGSKRTICQIPVLTAGEKSELKARIAETLRLAGLKNTLIALDIE